MVPKKLAICGKSWQFRPRGHFIKVVGNAILKTFYFMTFFPKTHPLATNDSCKIPILGIIQNGTQKNWPFVAKGGILDQKVTS